MSIKNSYKIGFRRPKVWSKYWIFNIIFLVVSVFCFVLINYLAFFLNLKNINFFEKTDSWVLKNILNQNPEINQLLQWVRVILQSSWNIFSDKQKIENLVNTYQNNQPKFEKFFPQFWESNKFLSQLLQDQSNIFQLLWEKQTQTYIILLMNDSEARPAGWFYWSFIEANLSWWHLDWKLHDSYWIKSLDNTWVNLDQAVKPYIPSQKINFIGWNEFGFSDIDWKNILQIYQQVFPEKNVAWVVFLNSQLIKRFLPWYEKKHIEWEFVNASIDLISWKFEAEKKKLYRNDASSYISENINTLAKESIKNFSSLKNYIKVYSPNTWLNEVLEKNWFVYKFDENNLYVFDYNDSFSKIDKFVARKIYLYSWENLLAVWEWESLPLVYEWKKLKWNYKVQIFYFLNVPNWYENYISSLEKKYNIALTARERHIMWLTYQWAFRTTLVWSWINYSSSFDSDSFSLYWKDYFYFRPSWEWNRKFKSYEIKLQIK